MIARAFHAVGLFDDDELGDDGGGETNTAGIAAAAAPQSASLGPTSASSRSASHFFDLDDDVSVDDAAIPSTPQTPRVTARPAVISATPFS